MVLHFIGLGLSDPSDISVKGLQIVKRAKLVFLQYYTSVLMSSKQQLQAFYQRPLLLADRDFCQLEIDKVLQQVQDQPSQDFAFLVVGDPFGATTHSDLFLRAAGRGIKVNIVFNAGIIGVVGFTGLQAYRFGEVVSIPLFTQKWRPYSFINKIQSNLKMGLHTLCLLDIKVKERSEQNILKDKKIYQPPRFMTASQAASQIIEASESSQIKLIDQQRRCLALARVGSKSMRVWTGSLKEMRDVDVGGPLHSVIICGQLHSMQKQMLQHWSKQ